MNLCGRAPAGSVPEDGQTGPAGPGQFIGGSDEDFLYRCFVDGGHRNGPGELIGRMAECLALVLRSGQSRRIDPQQRSERVGGESGYLSKEPDLVSAEERLLPCELRSDRLVQIFDPRNDRVFRAAVRTLFYRDTNQVDVLESRLNESIRRLQRGLPSYGSGCTFNAFHERVLPRYLRRSRRKAVTMIKMLSTTATEQPIFSPSTENPSMV